VGADAFSISRMALFSVPLAWLLWHRRKEMRNLRFVGIDSWDRPVYRDESGQLWKDVNLNEGDPSIYSVADDYFDNDNFNGEPDIPIKDEFEIINEEAK
jgi:hypothetical protein